MNRRDALTQMLECVKAGIGVVTGGLVHPDIPTGQHVCNRTKCDHVGHGLFVGMTSTGYRVNFDGGGWMRNAEADDVGARFGWSTLTAESRTPANKVRETIEAAGFDFEKVGDVLQEMLEEYEKGG